MELGIAALTPALNSTWTFVVLALFSIATVAYFAVRSRTRPIDMEKALQAFRSLDIDAFRNLVDRDEETYLRQNLPPNKFRRIKRQRAWAALLYAREAGRAAAALAQIGQLAQRSSDPAIAASGVEVADNAFRLRLQTLAASFHLLTEIVLPNLQPQSVPRLVDQYERSAHVVVRLSGFQQRFSN